MPFRRFIRPADSCYAGEDRGRRKGLQYSLKGYVGLVPSFTDQFLTAAYPVSPL